VNPDPVLGPDVRHLRSPYGKHARYCRFRIAAQCAIPIECVHGSDCCAICDPCTCKNPPRTMLLNELVEVQS
jgi:hypothetical protein